MNVCVNMYLKHHTRWKGLLRYLRFRFVSEISLARFNLIRLPLLWVSCEVFYVLKSRAFYQDIDPGTPYFRTFA